MKQKILANNDELAIFNILTMISSIAVLSS